MKPAFRLNRTASAAEPFGVLISDRLDLGSVHPRYEAYMNLEAARDAKESLAKTADSALQEGDSRYANIPVTPYELPDGTLVEVNIERFQMAEVLFDPSCMAATDSADLAALYGPLAGRAAPGSMDSVPKIVGACTGMEWKSRPFFRSCFYFWFCALLVVPHSVFSWCLCVSTLCVSRRRDPAQRRRVADDVVKQHDAVWGLRSHRWPL